jgi:hypothetical protein
VLERLIGVQLRAGDFLDFVSVAILGIDAAVEIELSRIGVVGTLAYDHVEPGFLGTTLWSRHPADQHAGRRTPESVDPTDAWARLPTPMR